MENSLQKKIPRIGLLTISLDGERTDYAERFDYEARLNLSQKGVEIINGPGLLMSTEELVKSSKALQAQDADCIIYLVGTWILADGAVSSVQQVSLPVAIWGVPEPVSFSSVGANVLHGALCEMDIKHRLFYGNTDDEETLNEVVSFCKAAMTVNRLKCARFGLIGGRAISAYTTTADPNQIKGLLGIEIEHIDQMVVLEKARALSDDKASAELKQIGSLYTKLDAPYDLLIKSVKVHMAIQEIIKEYRLDMASVKCLGEFINTYTSCCMAVVLANDAGFTMSCQGDINATISMHIIKLLSGCQAFFGDISTVIYKDKEVRMINCGAVPTVLSEDPKKVFWVPQYEYMGNGRGVCPVFCMKEGPVTFGYLGRKKGKYRMLIAQGEALIKDIDTIVSVRTWPQGFATLNGDPGKFYNNLLSNHCVMGYGSLEKDLSGFCDLLDIEKVIV
jgi:L-fucose isomerase